MEQIVSSGIIDSYFEKLKSNLSVDVAIVEGELPYRGRYFIGESR